MKKIDRILGLFLAIAMVFTVMPIGTIYASEGVYLSDGEESEITVLFEEDFEDFTLVDGVFAFTEMREDNDADGWYITPPGNHLDSTAANGNTSFTVRDNVLDEPELTISGKVLRMDAVTTGNCWNNMLTNDFIQLLPSSGTITFSADVLFKGGTTDFYLFPFWQKRSASNIYFPVGGSEGTACSFAANTWYTVKTVYNLDNDTVTGYIDDIQYATADYTVSDTQRTIKMRLHEYSGDYTFVDNIKVTHTPSPTYITFEDISNGQSINNVTGNLNLISTKDEYAFEWASSDTDVIALDGTVTTHPLDNAYVTLTATVKDAVTNTTLATVPFAVTVSAYTEGQRVLFEENFEGITGTLPASISTSTTEGYNDWRLSRDNYTVAQSDGTDLTIIQETADNKIFYAKRENYISKPDTDPDYAYYEQLVVNKVLPTIPMSDTVRLSWRMKTPSTYHNLCMGTILSEVRFDRVTLGTGHRFLAATPQQEALLTNKTDWMNYELIVDYTNNKTTLRINGQQIGDVATDVVQFSKLSLYLPNNSYYALGNVYIDDIKIMHIPDPVWVAFDDISNGQRIDDVTSNLTLIASKDGLDFEWSSNRPEVIEVSENTGIVTRPALMDSTVTLTATVREDGEVLGTKDIVVIVPSRGDVIYKEDFESAEIGTHLAVTTMSGYNGWVLNTSSAVDGAISPIEKAIAENSLLQIQKDPLDETNQVLHLRRDMQIPYCGLSPYDGKDPTQWMAQKNLTSDVSLDNGVIYVGGRIWFDSDGARITLQPFGAIRTDAWVCSANFNSGTKYEYTPEEAALWQIQKWNTFGFLLNFDDHSAQFYVNDVPVGPEVYMTLSKLENMVLYMARNERPGKHYMDSIVVKKANLPDSEWVDMALDDVVLDTPEDGVTEPIVLPDTSTYGTSISWASSNTDLIAINGSNGIVMRPMGDNQTVVLTATVSKNGVSGTKEFPVVVKGYSEIEYTSVIFDFDTIGNGQKEWYVTDDLSLVYSFNGATITWESSNTDVLTNGGQVIRSKNDVPVVFHATFELDGNTFMREFNLVIAGEGRIIVQEDFSAPSTDGQNVNGWNNWLQEDPTTLPSVNATVIKDFADTLRSYEDSEKILSIKRYMTGAEGKVCNHMVTKQFNAVKPEIMRIDFDFYFKKPNTTLYFELEGMNRHYGISQTGMGLKGYAEVPFGETLEANKWYHATIELDTYTNEFNVYLNYEKLNDEPIYNPGSAKVSSINFYSNFTTASTHEEFLLRRIMIRDTSVSAETSVANAKENLELNDIDYAAARLELPLYGVDNTRVIWASSNPEIISVDGVVTRPSAQQEVTMTATITKGNVSDTKEFTFEVSATSGEETPTVEILEVIASQLDEEDITDEPRFRLTQNLNLPTEITNGRAADIGGVDITWESNYPSVISADGIIFPQQYEVAATLTATISAKTAPDVTVQKELKFAAEIPSTVYADHPLDNMPENMAGQDILEWSTIQKRDRQTGTEYGTQIFADKEPGDRYLAYEDANKVFFLNRYTTAKFDPITDMSHATIFREGGGYGYGDVLTFSFRMKFLSGAPTKLKTTIYCQKEKNIYVTPTGITVSGNSYEGTFSPSLAFDEWHDFTFYYDMATWRMDIYVNGEYILSEPIVMGTGPYAYFGQWRFFNDSLGYLIVDDIRVRSLVLPNADAIVNNAMAIVEITDTLEENIKLPSYMGSCSVSWSSSDESVVSNGGVINPSSTMDKTAKLTATFRYDDVVKTKDFNVSVPAQPDYADKYEITDITVSADTVSAVKLDKKNDGTSTDKLMIAVYDQGEFIGLYLYDIPDDNTGDNITVATDISVADTVNYKVKVFAINCDDNNEKISNVYVCKEGNAE